MTKREPKSKLDIPTRTARAKAFDNLRRPDQVESIPFDELVAEPERGQVVRPPLSPSGGQTPTGGQTVAPARDFNRRANSLDRDALPAGYFPGTSKKLYDALYIRTVGAVVPRRTIFATKRDLAQWSGIKNRKTLDAHMRFFDMCGLVKRKWQPGQNEGYSFEVFLPEEIGLGDRPPMMVRPLEGTGQISDRGSDQKTGSGGQTQGVDFKEQVGTDKTSLIPRERTTDDEAAPFTGVIETFTGAVKDLTGKAPVASDEHRWREVAEVLITELRIAAGRTTVSSVPAFLAEHLRRRLWKKEKREIERDAADGTPQGDSAQVKTDSKNCPDCFGTGMKYRLPNFEGGVLRCTHEALRDSAPE